jgi:hypothetical protein
VRIATEEQRTQLRFDTGNEHTYGVSEGGSNPSPTRSRYRSVRYHGLTAIMQSPTHSCEDSGNDSRPGTPAEHGATCRRVSG